jgi:phosphopantothenoylcysteine decarboxylase/phosphopantothenate--cysteine ligase
MGYALAEAAAGRGARVILISGPVSLLPPDNCELVSVRTSEEMHRAVLARAKEASVIIGAAAVADFRPVAPSPGKIKRGTQTFAAIEVESTPDILADVAREKGARILVGFAAETDNVSKNARAKLAAKNVDLMVANDVTVPGAGFDSDTNIVTMFSRDGREQSLPMMSKLEVAGRVLDEVARIQKL